MTNNSMYIISLLLSTMLNTFIVISALNESLSTTCKNKNVTIAKAFSVIYVTTPNNEVAKKIAHGLIKERLAACVNIVPKIKSVYTWDGKINEDDEILLIIKTKKSVCPMLIEYVKSNHPYDVPEVISIPIEDGNSDYLKWLHTSIKDPHITDKPDQCH